MDRDALSTIAAEEITNTQDDALGLHQFSQVSQIEDAFAYAADTLNAPEIGEPEHEEGVQTAFRNAARQEARRTIGKLLNNAGDAVMARCIEPMLDRMWSELQSAFDDASQKEYARYVDAVQNINELITEQQNEAKSFKPKRTSQEKFEENRYVSFHTHLESILAKVDQTKGRIRQYKRIESMITAKISRTANEALKHMPDDQDPEEDDLDELFKTLKQAKADDEDANERLVDVQKEIKSLRAVLDGHTEAILEAVAEYYPAPEQDWTTTSDRGGQQSIIKNYRIDKQIDLIGPADATTGDKWINYNVLYFLVNAKSTFAILPGLIRCARQRSTTNVHWQPPGLNEWAEEPTAHKDFHVSKLIHTKEYVFQQSTSMWIKLSSVHDDIVQRARSGEITTHVGGKEIDSHVEDNDFLQLFSYYVQYHMQTTLVSGYILAQFFGSMGDAFFSTQDIVSEVQVFRKKLTNAKRVGLKLNYNGTILPAYLELVNRHGRFVDLLRGYSDCPAHIDPSDCLKAVEKFLSLVEKGARTLREIPEPTDSHRARRSGERYKALLTDVNWVGEKHTGNQNNHNTGNRDDSKFSLKLKGGKVICQRANPDCNKAVGRNIITKLRLSRLVEKGTQPHSVFCDACTNEWLKVGTLKTKSGDTRTAKSRPGKRILAALGKVKKSPTKDKKEGGEPEHETPPAKILATTQCHAAGERYIPLSKLIEYKKRAENAAAPTSGSSLSDSTITIVPDDEIDFLFAPSETSLP